MTISLIVRWHVFAPAAGFSVLAFTGALAAQGATGAASVRDGVFTAAQATRGAALYEEKCASCHADRMWGADWAEKSVFDIYDVVKTFMPEDAPGTLSARQTRDIVAHILRTNRFPAGSRELPAADEDLKTIKLATPSLP